MPKFKVGDTIAAIELYSGLEKATVVKADDKNYHLKILNGIAIIPIKAEVNYQKVKTKRR